MSYSPAFVPMNPTVPLCRLRNGHLMWRAHARLTVPTRRLYRTSHASSSPICQALSHRIVDLGDSVLRNGRSVRQSGTKNLKDERFLPAANAGEDMASGWELIGTPPPRAPSSVHYGSRGVPSRHGAGPISRQDSVPRQLLRRASVVQDLNRQLTADLNDRRSDPTKELRDCRLEEEELATDWRPWSA